MSCFPQTTDGHFAICIFFITNVLWSPLQNMQTLWFRDVVAQAVKCWALDQLLTLSAPRVLYHG